MPVFNFELRLKYLLYNVGAQMRYSIYDTIEF